MEQHIPDEATHSPIVVLGGGANANWYPVHIGPDLSARHDSELAASIRDLSKAHQAAHTNYVDVLYPETVDPATRLQRLGSTVRRIFTP